MTKGKRRRKRERTQQAARNSLQTPRLADAVITEAKEDAGDTEHSHTGADRRKVDIYMPPKAGISQWILDNANSVIAVFTIVIAVIAGIQACIYSAQLDWTRVEERAWVAVKFTPFPGPVANMKLAAPIIMGNTGKTVAKNIKGWAFFRPVPIATTINVSEYAKVSPSSLPKGEPIPAWTKFETGVIFPNDTMPLPQIAYAATPSGQSTPEPATWDSTLQDQWIHGEVYLALNGKVTYDDAVGTHHWTTFCTIFMAAGTGKNVSLDTEDRCTSYNTVDDNK